jgi:uncharacterized protein
VAERSADERLPLESLAVRGAVIERWVDGRDLPRFSGLCKPGNGVRAHLSFGPDDEGCIQIEGTLTASVFVDCQRCLEAVPLELSTDFAVVAVMNEADAARLGARGDVLELGTREPTVAEVIEDELILALPQRPCTRRNCDKAPPLAYPRKTQREDNPFGSLAALKET